MEDKDKCDQGYRGRCCCNCTNQLKLVKHPGNRGEFGKGSISEECGYVCNVPMSRDLGIYFENKHGMCEMYSPKIKDDGVEGK